MPYLQLPWPKWLMRTWYSVTSKLNFYRIHLIYYTVTPLFFSGLFHASNGRYHVAYIDGLFNCFSAFCCSGLQDINLSECTPWQQALLFIQMIIGNPILVQWFMVLVRRHYFARKFEHILAQAAQKRGLQSDEERLQQPTVEQRPHRSGGSHIPEVSRDERRSDRYTGHGMIGRLRPGMIRRMDDAPRIVNPSGRVTGGKAPSLENVQASGADLATSGYNNPHELLEIIPVNEFVKTSSGPATVVGNDGSRGRRLSDPGVLLTSAISPTSPIYRSETMVDSSMNETEQRFLRNHAIEFAPALQHPRGDAYTSDLRSTQRPSLTPYPTINTQKTQHSTQTRRTHRTTRSSQYRGFGGFPMPHQLIGSAIQKLSPRLNRQITRTLTIPATTSLVSTWTGRHIQHDISHTKVVPYISFDATVGRNSAFHLLTNEQMEELGGVEYRALNALLWIVGGYFIGIQLIPFIVIAPYISSSQWSAVFQVPALIRPVVPVWFSAFQVISCFSNTGFSLVDQSMVPFQRAYVMIIFLSVVILGGNCAYPIFLRFLIWTITKLIPRHSRLNETLHFLLDHPRRCYTHLFPSHQTWFLFSIILLLTFVDWFFFLILDIGDTVIEQIPLNIRVIDGLFQAVAVRTAGLAIVPLNNLEPAVKVLYGVMMYVSVYPIALSVRSTNVYEEQSLGVVRDLDEEFREEKAFQGSSPTRISVWSRYITLHIRRQLAFDMWWLATAVFLICIIERDGLNDPNNSSWFNIFNIIFEILSAYGAVGLSLGIANQNYALSGAFHTLSKLIVCVIIVRGRHRGLPDAIDRAVLLPSEIGRNEEGEEILLDTRSHASRGVGTDYNPQLQFPGNYSGRSLDDEIQFRRRVRRRETMSSISIHEPPIMTEIRSRPVSRGE